MTTLMLRRGKMIIFDTAPSDNLIISLVLHLSQAASLLALIKMFRNKSLSLHLLVLIENVSDCGMRARSLKWPLWPPYEGGHIAIEGAHLVGSPSIDHIYASECKKWEGEDRAGEAINQLFKCNMCGKTFPSYDVRKHMKKHRMPAVSITNERGLQKGRIVQVRPSQDFRAANSTSQSKLSLQG